jgi:CRP-like cAMP-binding protein
MGVDIRQGPDESGQFSSVSHTDPHSQARGPDGAAGEAVRGQAGEQNRLLRALAPADYERLQPLLERLDLPKRWVLVEPGGVITHAYFPQQCVLSVLNVMNDGVAVETQTVGNEGMAGLGILFGSDIATAQVICQVPDGAKRIAASSLRAAFKESPPLLQLLLRYAQTAFTQVSQSSACNRAHSMPERCARWLLMTHDRVGGADTFELTQDFLAIMLGVRRPSVTLAAGILQQAGLIRYVRGKITVIDRPGLEAASCECYRIICDDYERMLGAPTLG